MTEQAGRSISLRTSQWMHLHHLELKKMLERGKIGRGMLVYVTLW